jgi:integrase/recombinase XerD
MRTCFDATAFESLYGEVVATLANEHTRGMYRKALKDFAEWWRTTGNRPLDKSVVLAHIDYLLASAYSEATVNQRLSAIKKAILNAEDRGLLDLATARDILRINGFSKKVSLGGRFLTERQAEALINVPNASSVKGVRDRAVLALLVGCALRSGELVSIQVEEIQKQKGEWFLTNVVGSRGDVRAVVIPDWTRKALDAWLEISGIRGGALLRAVDRLGNVAERSISSYSVLPLVAEYGRSIGIDVKPRDLRRTCAQLCRTEGGELEQIQLLLGHASVETTQHYLGRKRTVASAPNGRLRMKWHNRKIAS